MKDVSEEQLIIFDYIKDGFNVCIDAIPGSGKSTSMLTLSEIIPNKKLLHITYNSMLRKEFKEKTVIMKIENMDVHTYHSFAVKTFSQDAYTDTGLRKILQNKITPYNDIPNYDILILDECQDMSALYFQFVLYFLSFFKSKIQLIILGDFMQGIYDFKGADIRFLTMAKYIWKDNPFLSSRVFKECSLSMSYRITNQMAKYINTSMLTKNRLKACRDGIPVQYIRNSIYSTEKIIVNIIKRILDEGDVASDIFILAGSVKGTNSNVRRIENSLTQMGIPCYIPNNVDSTKVDERVVDGKVVFSTFHTVKGMQRKYVFVVGFDDNYFQFMGKNLPKNSCPNVLFVAATRATHVLYLLESNNYSTDKPLGFLSMSHHDMKRADFVDFKGIAQTIFYDSPNSNNNSQKTITHYLTPTELVKFIPENTMDQISPLIEDIFTQLTNKYDNTDLDKDIPIIVQFTSGLWEDISDINGIAIPALYYDYIVPSPTNSSSLYSLIQEHVDLLGDTEHSFLKSIFKELNPICKTPSEYLYMSNVYFAMKEKLYFKLKQIKIMEYNWLKQDVVENCKRFLDKHIITDHNDKLNIKQEMTIIHNSSDELHLNIDMILSQYINKGIIPDAKYRFTARVDIVTNETIFEIKCCSSVTLDHQIQVVIYAFLWKTMYPLSQKKFKILNIKTGEVIQLNASYDILTKIVVLLLKGKFGTLKYLSDTEFITSNLKTKYCNKTN
jgi:hypothetical protein